MGVSPVSTSDLAAINVYFSKDLIPRNLSNWVVYKFADLSKDIPQKSGQRMTFKKFASLADATTPLTEGVTPAGSKPTASTIYVDVSLYGDFIPFTDVFELTQDSPDLVEFNKLLAEQSSNTFDVLTFSALGGGTVYRRANGRVNRNQIVAADKANTTDLRIILRTLRVAKAKPIKKMLDGSPNYGTVPVAESFVAFIDGYAEFDITELTGFVPVEEYASKSDVIMGEIGKYKQLRFVRAENVPVFEGEGDSGIDVHCAIILGTNAFGISKIAGKGLESITKPIGSAGSDDPCNQRGSMAWKGYFAAKIIREENMARYEFAVS
jgi:N4-gp56 family major capsid protein